MIGEAITMMMIMIKIIENWKNWMINIQIASIHFGLDEVVMIIL